MPTAAIDEQSPLEDRLVALQVALRRGNRPDLTALLPSGSERVEVLVELVHAELEFRLKAGEAARVEEYFARYPELQSDRAVFRSLIEAEAELCRRRDPDFNAAEFYRRFPGFRLPDADTTPDVSARMVECSATIIVPGYEIISELGRGGAGVVFKREKSLWTVWWH